ncbi:hypothetical protein LY76DRAFT_687099 [Colletotrichum caudatum]|nr:hypothetical protein LY76DRAFT_687099 [Colletotrichum caudatum]
MPPEDVPLEDELRESKRNPEERQPDAQAQGEHGDNGIKRDQHNPDKREQGEHPNNHNVPDERRSEEQRLGVQGRVIVEQNEDDRKVRNDAITVEDKTATHDDDLGVTFSGFEPGSFNIPEPEMGLRDQQCETGMSVCTAIRLKRKRKRSGALGDTRGLTETRSKLLFEDSHNPGDPDDDSSVFDEASDEEDSTTQNRELPSFDFSLVGTDTADVKPEGGPVTDAALLTSSTLAHGSMLDDQAKDACLGLVVDALPESIQAFPSLLVLRFDIYDSLHRPAHIQYATRVILNLINRYIEKGHQPWRHLIQCAIQQQNGVDCGVMVIAHAIHVLARHMLPQTVNTRLWRDMFRELLLEEQRSREEPSHTRDTSFLGPDAMDAPWQADNTPPTPTATTWDGGGRPTLRKLQAFLKAQQNAVSQSIQQFQAAQGPRLSELDAALSALDDTTQVLESIQAVAAAPVGRQVPGPAAVLADARRRVMDAMRAKPSPDENMIRAEESKLADDRQRQSSGASDIDKALSYVAWRREKVQSYQAGLAQVLQVPTSRCSALSGLFSDIEPEVGGGG